MLRRAGSQTRKTSRGSSYASSRPEILAARRDDVVSAGASREVPVAVRIDLVDVVVRLVRVADRRGERERGADVEHPEARRRVASRRPEVSRGAPEDLGHLAGA